MAIRTVLTLGHPLLFQSAAPVTAADRSLAALLRDMFDTMHHGRGSGLAAPQIGVLQQVIVLEYDKLPDFPGCDAIPPTVLINPQYRALNEEQDLAWEGCLSVPELRGLVRRHTLIEYEGLDEQGRKVKDRAAGFYARVLQHEIDHLRGIVYTQRLADTGQFGFLPELRHSGRMREGSLPCDDPSE